MIKNGFICSAIILSVVTLSACGKTEKSAQEQADLAENEALRHANEATANEIVERTSETGGGFLDAAAAESEQHSLNDAEIDALLNRFGAKYREAAPHLASAAEALDDPSAKSDLCAYHREISAANAASQSSKISNPANVSETSQSADQALEAAQPELNAALNALKELDWFAHMQWKAELSELCSA